MFGDAIASLVAQESVLADSECLIRNCGKADARTHYISKASMLEKAKGASQFLNSAWRAIPLPKQPIVSPEGAGNHVATREPAQPFEGGSGLECP